MSETICNKAKSDLSLDRKGGRSELLFLFDDKEMAQELQNLYWQGAYSTLLVLSAQSPELREQFLQSAVSLPFEKFVPLMKEYVSFRLSGKPLN